MLPKPKFKIDENLPPDFAVTLKAKGYDTTTVKEQGLNGKNDTIVSTVCRAEGRTLITQDRGFGDIRVYPPELYNGIIVLQTKMQDRVTYGHLLEKVIDKLETTPLEGKLWVVDERSIRVRSGAENGSS